jgi:hypothetical protein
MPRKRRLVGSKKGYGVPVRIIIGSSVKIVGEFWLGKLAKDMK